MDRCATSVVRWVVAITAGLVAGCSGEEDDGDTPQDKLEQLEACGAPVPCNAMLTYAVDDTVAACMLGSMSAAELAQHHVEGSVTGDERYEWDLFVSTDRSVQVVYREFLNGPDAEWSYTLSACVLRPPSFFEDCLAATPIDGSCLDPDDWAADCTALTEVHCP
jgi:hypothetical protein